MRRRKQAERTLWEGVVDEDVRALWEPWMVEADKLLEDEQLIDVVYEAQASVTGTAAPAVGRKLPPRWRCACCC